MDLDCNLQSESDIIFNVVLQNRISTINAQMDINENKILSLTSDNLDMSTSAYVFTQPNESNLILNMFLERKLKDCIKILKYSNTSKKLINQTILLMVIIFEFE